MSFKPGDNLRQVLPRDAQLDLDGRDKQLAKLLDVPVLAEYDARDREPAFSHRNVTVWWVLENGFAVGLNENPSVGWSFPVMRVQKDEFDALSREAEQKRAAVERAHAVIILHKDKVDWRMKGAGGSNPHLGGMGETARTLNAVMKTVLGRGAQTFEFIEG